MPPFSKNRCEVLCRCTAHHNNEASDGHNVKLLSKQACQVFSFLLKCVLLTATCETPCWGKIIGLGTSRVELAFLSTWNFCLFIQKEKEKVWPVYLIGMFPQDKYICCPENGSAWCRSHSDPDMSDGLSQNFYWCAFAKGSQTLKEPRPWTIAKHNLLYNWIPEIGK